MSGRVAVRRSRDARLVLSSFRAALLLGTALAAPRAALAENIVSNTPGDYALTRADTLSGGPRVIDITTTSSSTQPGNITLDIGGVQVANSTVNTGAGIAADTTADTGTVDITSGTITASGTQLTRGIDVRAGTGAVRITSNSVTSDSSSQSQGIYVLGGNNGSGNVAITSGSATGARRGIFVNVDGTVNVNSGTAVANGADHQSEAIVAIGSSATVVSQSAAATNAANVNGGGIFALGYDGEAHITSQQASIAGTQQSGVQIAGTGNGSIDSGSVAVLGSDSDAVKTGMAGLATITSDGITSTGANVRGIVSDTYELDADDIYAPGATNITSNTISLTGAGSTGIDVSGTDTTIKSGSIAVNGTGITVDVSGTVAIDSGTITNSSTRGTAISVTGKSVTIASDTISGGAFGIGGTAQSDLTITSGGIALQTIASSNVNALSGYGINAILTDVGTIKIVSGAIQIAGTGNSYGIEVQHTGVSGAIDITSGSISVHGNGGFGISAASSGANVTVHSTGDITTTGTTRAAGGSTAAADQRFADGIDAFSRTGTIAVTNDGVISTAGVTARGIDVEAGRALTTFASGGTDTSTAALTITNTGTVQTAGATANAVNVLSDANTVTVANSGALKTGGANSAGIQISAGTGSVAIANTGAIATTGTGSYGIAVTPTSGTTTITGTGTVATAGDNAHGIYLSPGAAAYTGATSITAGPITTSGANAIGIYAINTSGAVSIDASDIRTTGANASAIVVQPVSGSTAPITVQAGIIRVAGANTAAINLSSNGIAGPLTVGVADSISTGVAVDARSSGAVSVTGGTVQVTGGAATGLIAISSADSATVNSGTLAVTDNRGIFAAGATNTSVTSGNLTTTGADYDYALIAQNSATGGVTVNSTALTSGSGGIDASGNGTIAVTSGTVTTSGADRASILVSGQAGNVSVTSGTVTTSGAGAQGIFAQTSTGNITIASNSTVTTATGVSANNNTSDAVFGYASGAGSVTITSGNAATAGDYANAIGAVGGGTISVTSGTAGTTGDNISTIYAYGRGAGAVTVDADTTTATGTGAWAVEAHSVSGTVTINSGTASAANGIAVYGAAASPQLVSITAQNSSAGGDGFSAINAVGGSIDLNIGTASSSGNSVGESRADAVFALASTGAVNATIGSATATGVGADAVHIVADGTAGAANVTITGAVSSAQGTGLFIDPPGLTTVSIAQGASVSGAVAGIDVTSDTGNAIVNLGTVSSANGPAILASGTTSLLNAGTIVAGNGGVAIQLGATDDTVTLATGSSVSGTIAGGGGIDRAVLAGTGTTAAANQTIAAFDGFDSLRVASGYWTAGATPSRFNTATVDSGAALELANGATGITGIVVPTITDNGTLVIRSSADAAGSTFGATTVTGSGAVMLAGPGTVTLDGTNSIATTGGITVANGATLLVTGTQGGTVTTAAGGTFQIGNGTTVGTFTGDLADNGTVVLNHSDDYSFTGAVTGTGTLVKQGAGRLILGSNYAFTGTTQIVAGSIKLTGAVDPTTQLDLTGGGTLDFSGTQQTVAELAGNNAAAKIDIDGGSLTVDQSTNTAFAGSITGNGGFTKAGTGSLNFTGTSTYTGPTVVEGGRLAVNGSIVSAVTVESGATLGGTGTIGGATIVAGGTYAPGNSIGTQTVAGNVVFRAGSIYAVETNADGRSDRINATGTATLAGTVSVLAQAGAYANVTDYTILTATGGVSGTFANATSNLAFLTPLLSYATNAVTLTLARNDVRFAAVANTPNQTAVANAVQGLGVGNVVYNSVLRQTAAGARASFDAFSGEVYAAVPSVLIDQGRRVRDAVVDRAGVEEDGIGVWGTAMRNAVNGDAHDGIAATKTDRKGIVSGIDIGRNGLRIGAYGGYIDTDLGVVGRASHAGIKTGLAGGYAAWTSGKLSVKVGGDYDWHTVDVRRTVTLSTGATQNTGKYDAHTLQAFGEIDYRLIDGPVTVTPFGAYAHVRTHSDGVTETGNAAALDVASRNRNVDTTNVGLRIGGTAPVTDTVAFLPKAVVSWQHGWGDLRGGSVASFGTTGGAFGVAGARLAGNAANAELGFDLAIGQRLRIGTGGYMSYSRDWSDYGGTVSVGFRF